MHGTRMRLNYEWFFRIFIFEKYRSFHRCVNIRKLGVVNASTHANVPYIVS